MTLSPRELQILALVAEGYRNHEIGRELLISEETVKSYIKSVLDKTGARNRSHAVALGLRSGVLGAKVAA